MTETKVPFCFTRAQYRLWQEAAKLHPPGVSSHCSDCTPEYQSRMIRCGDCAHPGTTFHRVGNFLEGFRPEAVVPKAKEAA